MTILTRRKLEGVGQEYGVDIGAEETAGRLTQHIEGQFYDCLTTLIGFYSNNDFR